MASVLQNDVGLSETLYPPVLYPNDPVPRQSYDWMTIKAGSESLFTGIVRFKSPIYDKNNNEIIGGSTPSLGLALFNTPTHTQYRIVGVAVPTIKGEVCFLDISDNVRFDFVGINRMRITPKTAQDVENVDLQFWVNGTKILVRKQLIEGQIIDGLATLVITGSPTVEPTYFEYPVSSSFLQPSTSFASGDALMIGVNPVNELNDLADVNISIPTAPNTLLKFNGSVWSAQKETISNLSDVDLTVAPLDNQVLTYDTVTSKWKAENVPSGSTTLSALTDVQLTAPLKDGEQLTYDTTTNKWKNEFGLLEKLSDVNLVSPPADKEGLVWDDAIQKWVNGQVFTQAGNAFSATQVIGTQDLYEFSVITNNATKLTVDYQTNPLVYLEGTTQGTLATRSQIDSNSANLTVRSGDVVDAVAGNVSVVAGVASDPLGTHGQIALTTNGNTLQVERDGTVSVTRPNYEALLSPNSNDIPNTKWVNDQINAIPPQPTITASNIGTAGVGFFKSKVGNDLQFKKVNAGSAKITITDDVANNEVDVDLGTVTLDNLSDVVITAPVSTNEALIYNGTNWVNAVLPATTYTQQNVWVDNVNGIDAVGRGSMLLPYKTINYAYGQVPSLGNPTNTVYNAQVEQYVTEKLIINLASGRYNENVVVGFKRARVEIVGDGVSIVGDVTCSVKLADFPASSLEGFKNNFPVPYTGVSAGMNFMITGKNGSGVENDPTGTTLNVTGNVALLFDEPSVAGGGVIFPNWDGSFGQFYTYLTRVSVGNFCVTTAQISATPTLPTGVIEIDSCNIASSSGAYRMFMGLVPYLYLANYATWNTTNFGITNKAPTGVWTLKAHNSTLGNVLGAIITIGEIDSCRIYDLDRTMRGTVDNGSISGSTSTSYVGMVNNQFRVYSGSGDLASFYRIGSTTGTVRYKMDSVSYTTLNFSRSSGGVLTPRTLNINAGATVAYDLLDDARSVFVADPATNYSRTANTVDSALEGIDTALGTKQNSLGVGTTSQYLRGDVTFQTLNLDALSDVVITAPVTTNQVVQYNGTNWVNATIADSTTASNIGTAGVGVFKSKVGNDLQFKKVNAGSAKITITDDVANNEVDVDLGTVTLDNLSDVVISAPSTNQVLSYNGTNWINSTAPSNPSSTLFRYKIHTIDQVPPPNTARIVYNNVVQVSATELYVNHVDEIGDDVDILLNLVPKNSTLIIQNRIDSNSYQTFKVTAVPTPNVGYVTYTVELTDSAGTGTTGFPNNEEVVLILVNANSTERLSDLTDVNISSVADKEGLIYNSLISKWVNGKVFTDQGNVFGATQVLGSIDNNDLTFLTNNVAKVTIDKTTDPLIYLESNLQTTIATRDQTGIVNSGNIEIKTGNTENVSSGSLLLTAGVCSTDPNGNGQVQLKTSGTNTFTLESDGTLSTNVATYEALVTSNNDIPNKKYVDDKVSTVKSGLIIYQTELTNNTPPPSTGKIKFNNIVDQKLSTELYISTTPTSGVDTTWLLSYLFKGSIIQLIDSNDSINYQLWNLTANPIQNVGYITIPVSTVQQSGTGLTNFPNNLSLDLLFIFNSIPLDYLNDVDASTPNDKDTILYDSSTSTWVTGKQTTYHKAQLGTNVTIRDEGSGGGWQNVLTLNFTPNNSQLIAHFCLNGGFSSGVKAVQLRLTINQGALIQLGSNVINTNNNPPFFNFNASYTQIFNCTAGVPAVMTVDGFIQGFTFTDFTKIEPLTYPNDHSAVMIITDSP